MTSRECQQGGAFCAGSGRAGACRGQIAHHPDPLTGVWRTVPCGCGCHGVRKAGQ